MDKGRIIELSLLRLGKNNEYNDNKSKEYTVAEKLLDDVLDSLAKDTSLLYNSTTVILNKFTPGENSLNEKRFNKPVDLVNIIRMDVTSREEGEFIYSSSDTVKMQYCREISILETPIYMKDLIIYELCKLMCLAFSSYQDKLQYFEAKAELERQKIINNQMNNFRFGGN